MARKARSLEEPTPPPAPEPTQETLDLGKPKKSRRKKSDESPPATPASASPAPSGEAIPIAAAPTAFKFIAFGDLHVSAKTLDRAVDLLTRVGDLAVAHDAGIVCTGDFWDARASLSVRQLDAILNVLQRWREQGRQVVMLPGNHDQVALDGSIHAVRVFEPFDNVVVATQPLIDAEAKLAFLPWREVPGEQAALFSGLASEGTGWTIFAHAEVKGARTNGGHAAAGRVDTGTIESLARACYLGHYHKRQKLGDRTWYLGSPFEMNFGEADEPHGVALITSDNPEPAFLDIDDFPKHVRATWPDDREKLAAAREIDIVELQMSREQLHSPELAVALATTKARDVRPIPIGVEKSESGAPVIALSLDNAIDEWVRNLEGIEDMRKSFIKSHARDILRAVADKKTIVPFAPEVRVCKVMIDNFCAIRGHADMDLADLSTDDRPHPGLGPFLLRGPMGAGKTSLCDAITWCLFGITTPRKAGERSGGLKADDVIHDAADEVKVAVALQLCPMPNGDPWGTVRVERTKKRGKGAEIRIYGAGLPTEGIADQQEIIHRIVGLDADLWRSTVYLGQGAVANFITDADKKRKELLARAFGLGAVEPALKLARDSLKEAVQKRQVADQAVQMHTATLDALRGTDLTTQSQAWEAQKHARLEALIANLHEEYKRIQEIDPHLAAEKQWLDTKLQYEAHRDALVKSLTAGGADDRRAQLQREMGAAQAEKALAVKRLNDARTAYAALSDPMQTPICTKCGQALDEERRAIQSVELEQEIPMRDAEIANFDARISNAFLALQAMGDGSNPHAAQIQAQITECNATLEKCATALNAITKLKANREAALARYQASQAEHAKLSAEANPFAAKAAETATKIARVELDLKVAQTNAGEAMALVSTLEEVERMFSPKGLPVLVLRTVIYELETHANRFLGTLLGGRIHCAVSLAEEDLDILWYEYDPVQRAHVERSFFQLSGGQRRCCELAFAPFALSEMIFARSGVRVPFLVVDELTTHLDPDTKPLVCKLLHSLNRETVVVIDHDAAVTGEFDRVYDVKRDESGTVSLVRSA